MGGARLTGQPRSPLEAAVLSRESRACRLLSAAWSSLAVCVGRSAAALQPPGQAAGPRCASVPHTASPFPGESRTGSRDSTVRPNKGRDFPHRARGSGTFEATWQLYTDGIHSEAVIPAPVTDLECAQHLESRDKEQDKQDVRLYLDL